MTTVAPNPPSPFADADPQYRHLFAEMLPFGPPSPGVLALAGCDRLAVVPDTLQTADPNGELPDGLCPACLAVARGQEPPADVQPVSQCQTCESSTQHNGLCAMCRQEFHDVWVAGGSPDITLEQAVIHVLFSDYFADAAREHLDDKDAAAQQAPEAGQS